MESATSKQPFFSMLKVKYLYILRMSNNVSSRIEAWFFLEPKQFDDLVIGA